MDTSKQVEENKKTSQETTDELKTQGKVVKDANKELSSKMKNTQDEVNDFMKKNVREKKL